MSTAELIRTDAEQPSTQQPGMELARFRPNDAAIATLAAQYMPLTIKDVKDVAGFKMVHQARMTVKSHRVEVEKIRKELKADSLDDLI